MSAVSFMAHDNFFDVLPGGRAVRQPGRCFVVVVVVEIPRHLFPMGGIGAVDVLVQSIGQVEVERPHRVC